MNRIRIEDCKQLFSLFEQIITDFPKESEIEEEIVEDKNEENEWKYFVIFIFNYFFFVFRFFGKICNNLTSYIKFDLFLKFKQTISQLL